jgi:hypothetical protein
MTEREGGKIKDGNVYAALSLTRVKILGRRGCRG